MAFYSEPLVKYIINQLGEPEPEHSHLYVSKNGKHSGYCRKVGNNFYSDNPSGRAMLLPTGFHAFYSLTRIQ